MLLEPNQACEIYHSPTQRHSLQFAEKKTLDLVHRIVLTNHRGIHLRP